jgi:hypothetical protein
MTILSIVSLIISTSEDSSDDSGTTTELFSNETGPSQSMPNAFQS